PQPGPGEERCPERAGPLTAADSWPARAREGTESSALGSAIKAFFRFWLEEKDVPVFRVAAAGKGCTVSWAPVAGRAEHSRRRQLAPISVEPPLRRLLRDVPRLRSQLRAPEAGIPELLRGQRTHYSGWAALAAGPESGLGPSGKEVTLSLSCHSWRGGSYPNAVESYSASGASLPLFGLHRSIDARQQPLSPDPFREGSSWSPGASSDPPLQLRKSPGSMGTLTPINRMGAHLSPLLPPGVTPSRSGHSLIGHPWGNASEGKGAPGCEYSKGEGSELGVPRGKRAGEGVRTLTAAQSRSVGLWPASRAVDPVA
ncbi:hypothetical protein MC885_013139, partial [Smutsia gigantea]